ncbi:MAG: phosphate ABC transporter substrate-binding protein [Deltaproteobacteria bacterium]|nr:phosphate ABC transporter substrate-binding protein [Candidatus Tharpella aukensis]
MFWFTFKKESSSFKYAVLLALLSFLCFFNSAAQAESTAAFRGQTGVLRISGGTAHIPVMKEVSKIIMQAYPDIQISIAGGGSGAGIKQVGEGLVDIGNSGRKPTEHEIQKYGLVLHRWAFDGVGVIVHRDNRVQALTKGQLQDIFSGRLRNWQEVGGVDKEITVFTRDEASGTRNVFWKKALAKKVITNKALVVASNGAMKAGVSHNPYAIGYVSIGYLDKSVAAVVLDGVKPSLEAVQKGEYTVVRGLYSNTKGERDGLTKSFIDFLFSQSGREIIAKKGLIPAAR